MINPTAPAFPLKLKDNHQEGIDIRTYIATQLLAGMAGTNQQAKFTISDHVDYAVKTADTLISKLNDHGIMKT